MSCKLEDRRPDWKAYALGELTSDARREAEAHAATCSDCQDELAGLRVTLDAMATLREEEVPRRIAFVSDKVFEPTWWQRTLASFRQPSFAAGAVVAAAILVHAFVRPAGVPQGTAPVNLTAQINAEIGKRVQEQVQAQLHSAVDQAVAKAVADTEKSDDQRAAQVLAAAERRYADTADLLSRQVTQMYALNTGAGVR